MNPFFLFALYLAPMPRGLLCNNCVEFHLPTLNISHLLKLNCIYPVHSFILSKSIRKVMASKSDLIN